MGMKFKDLSLKNNVTKVILVVVAVVAAIFIQWIAVPVVFTFYILLSLLYKNKVNNVKFSSSTNIKRACPIG